MKFLKKPCPRLCCRLMLCAITFFVLALALYQYRMKQPASKSTFDIEKEVYKNNLYGYSLEVPKGWGAISSYGGVYESELYDEMETIGPLLPHFGFKENEQYFYIGFFSDKNSAKDPNESWFDFYQSLYLDGKSYETNGVTNMYSTTQVHLKDENGQYIQTRLLMEHDDKLYEFSFHRDNYLHRNIVQSIKLW